MVSHLELPNDHILLVSTKISYLFFRNTILYICYSTEHNLCFGQIMLWCNKLWNKSGHLQLGNSKWQQSLKRKKSWILPPCLLKVNNYISCQKNTKINKLFLWYIRTLQQCHGKTHENINNSVFRDSIKSYAVNKAWCRALNKGSPMRAWSLSNMLSMSFLKQYKIWETVRNSTVFNEQMMYTLHYCQHSFWHFLSLDFLAFNPSLL